MQYIKNNISRIICGLKYTYFLITSHNIFKINVNKRFFLDGDKNFLIKHNLNSSSVVFEVGGYTGVFSDLMIKLYNPYIYIFEPVQEYYDILHSKYSDNKKVKVFGFGLSDKDSTISIAKSNDGSSVFKQGNETEEIVLKDIYDFLRTENLIDTKINLISINIEGGEYQLLDRILHTTPNVFANIQVQFHDFVESASAKRNSILDTLYKNGYTCGYSFPFVRELFKK